MEPEDVIKAATTGMKKALDHALHEYNTIHTGKASPSMVESLPVEAYGSTVKLMEVAAITTPDARTLSIQPWDKGTMKDVERAIQMANIGLNPIARGNSLLCPLPELSGERRKEMTKIVHGMTEHGKVGIRAARRDAMDALKKMEKDKELSEDDHKRFEKDVQAETDRFVKELDQHAASKEKELMQV